MHKKIIILLMLFLAIVFNGWAQVDSTQKAKPDSVATGCASPACHGNLVSQEVVHHPVKRGCEKCHQANGQEHPKKDVKGFTLVKEVPGLCYKCHDENNVQKHVHSPVQQGKCLDCHNPHSSPESNLLVLNPESKLCAKCHNLESAKKVVKHEPVVKGECIKCHDPHQSDNERLLAIESPTLCLKCHKKQSEEIKMTNVHPPFQNNCLNCHSQHSSSEAKLLNLTTQNLCIYCHDDMQKRIEKATVVHGALTDKKSCINCHSPHASEQKKFLMADAKALCLNCHDRAYKSGNRQIENVAQVLQKSKSVHAAIDKAGCTGCHDPHTSVNPYLLNKAFPEGSYALANKDNFALCFSCHKGEMIDKGSTATGFRNGDVNLHNIHINGEKGRSCIVCHNPHGSANDHLINDRTQFGSWAMPLNYKTIENGGSCAPGCHTERKYERIIAATPKK